MISSLLTIGTSPKRGRGVFAAKNIKKGTVIEISPVIVLTEKERKTLEKTLLFHYVFEWGKDSKQCCMALGYVPVYNHSYQSNCEYEMDFENEIIKIKTIRLIKEKEELFINYNGDWNNGKKIWFEVK